MLSKIINQILTKCIIQILNNKNFNVKPDWINFERIFGKNV